MVYLISNQKEAFETDSYQKASLLDVITYCKDLDAIGVDTETGGFDPYTCSLLMLQLGDRLNQFVIDVNTVGLDPLKHLLENKVLILHNAKFDLRFLYHQGIVPKEVFDTFLAERILSTGIDSHQKNLLAVAQRYVSPDIRMDKEVRTNIRLDTRSILYAADDVKYLHEIKSGQEKKLTAQNLEHTMTLDNQFVRALAYMEYSGIYLDKNMWKKKAQQDTITRAEKEKLCNEWMVDNLPKTKWVNAFGDLFNPSPTCKINWDSPKQCVELFKHLGVNVVTIEKGKKKESVDAKVLRPQQKEFPLIPLYLEYKEQEKLCSTYGMSFFKQINPVTQRIHTQFNQIITFVTYTRNGVWKKFREFKESLQIIDLSLLFG